MSNQLNDSMNNTKPMTDAELEAQFVERNQNLKQTLNNIVDKIDTAATKTQDFLETNANQMSNNLQGNNLQSSQLVHNDRMTTMAVGTGNFDNGLYKTAHGGGEDNIDMSNNMLDRKMMNSIRQDIQAMHSSDPEVFEGVATKMDETFGHNALV
ncbi:hypothetical protein A0J61_07570 [Choanephora cucurbitarum]|uniref:Uncharacterized protein n=1 Tax=Choanephora cucurbitarum TaxID=101091 RepID=A0A1C7N5G8_9FUNG|nr:hypothetical protein A0J61_07570 [Choanephora cucurbitarum]